MWREFFRFDLAYQLRQPLFWLCAIGMGALAFGASGSDALQLGGTSGNVKRNAPTVVAQFFIFFSVLSMFIVTLFIAAPVVRDSEVGIADILFATPMRKRDYLIGRFAAGLVVCLGIFVLIAVGLMLGPLMLALDPQRLGPFSLYAYGWSFAIIVIPNLLFIGALLLLLAATTRSMMMVYVGLLAFFVLWATAGTLTRDIGTVWISTVLDPFGMRAYSRAIRYFSAAQSNAGLPLFSGYLLANRALWSGIALLMFGATLALFKPQRMGTARARFRTQKHVALTAPAQAGKWVRAAPRFDRSTAWRQCWHILRFDAAAVFKSVPFMVMMLIGTLNLVESMVSAASLYGTPSYPVTGAMLKQLTYSYNFILVIIVTFYAGELIFKERQARIADLSDAMPVRNWVPLLAKSLALVAVILGFMFGGAVVAIGFQLIKGGVPVEPVLYLKGILLGSLPFVLMGLCALALQVLANNKFVGYLTMLLLMLSQMALRTMNLDHNLYNFAGLPAVPYSDMNGYGHFLYGWSWYALYWSLCTVALLVVAQAFWVRGTATTWRVRIRQARRRLHGNAGAALVLSLAAFAGSGVWIFYNTTILNAYETGDAKMDRQARYEKLYRQYKDLPHPKVTDVRAEVDIYPAERRLALRGRYVLQNKSAIPLDTLRIQESRDGETTWAKLPRHQVIVDDKESGFKILKLAQAIAPGRSVELDFNVNVRRAGFSNSGAADSINLNGTFFNNAEFFPHFGYDSSIELLNPHERRKRGLGAPERMRKLEDDAARANTVYGADADWIRFDTTVSTSSDQIAIAPGYLQKQWQLGARRYFHYTMDQPIMPFFTFLSGRWEVRKADWRGLPIEIYYDKKHGYNVDRMVSATQKTLDYFDAQLTPYQHRQVRILEFPNYRGNAQSFANTIPYSEDMGFIADLRDKDDIDYVLYMTAHEMAHQWWGHQVVGADVQGATMLMETLAQYSALMVMEKEYGRAKLRRFLRYELDSYLSGRGRGLLEEQPLFRVENEPYIHYRKGALILYRLRDEIGEAAVNRALKQFLVAKRFQQAPFTTTRELLGYIRAEAPADQQALITDMFEKIVFYDNRVTTATASQRADGKWDVTMQLHLAKIEADGKGAETVRKYDEAVEVAVFARPPGAGENDERILYTEKRMLQGSDPTFTVTVAEKPYDVGVDPYNKMIDRVARDNRKAISFK